MQSRNCSLHIRAHNGTPATRIMLVTLEFTLEHQLHNSMLISIPGRAHSQLLARIAWKVGQNCMGQAETGKPPERSAQETSVCVRRRHSLRQNHIRSRMGPGLLHMLCPQLGRPLPGRP
jgi:hypothetical protein